MSWACRRAGVSRDTAYAAYKSDPTFKAAWDDALETACDELEGEARRRAHHGVKRPIYWGGKRVGFVMQYSDTLLMFLLRAHRPHKFRERFEVSQAPPLTPEQLRLLTDEELDQALAGKLSHAQLVMIVSTRQGADAGGR